MKITVREMIRLLQALPEEQQDLTICYCDMEFDYYLDCGPPVLKHRIKEIYPSDSGEEIILILSEGDVDSPLSVSTVTWDIKGDSKI